METPKSPEQGPKAKPESFFRGLGRIMLKVMNTFVDMFVPTSSKKGK